MGETTMNKEELKTLAQRNTTRAQSLLPPYQTRLALHKKQYKQILLHPRQWLKTYRLFKLSISNMLWVIEYSKEYI